MKYYRITDADGDSIVRVPKGKTLEDLGYHAAGVRAVEVEQPRITAEDRERERRSAPVAAMTVGELEDLVRRLIGESGKV